MNVPKLRFKEFDGEWEKKKIGGFFDHLSTGSTPSRTNPDYFKGEIPWISSGELKSHYISDTKEHVSELAVKETNLKIHPPGTFFIAITGLEAKGTRSSAAINTVPMTTNQSCLAFKPNDLIDLNFLYFWYKKNGERIGITYTQGTKQQSLTPGLVRDLDITVPKIEEQKYISRFFNIVEKKIELQQQKIDLLQEQKKGFLQKMFPKSGETQPEMRFEGFEGDWEERKLKEVGKIITGNTPSTTDKSNYAEQGILWVTPTDIKHLITTETSKKLSIKGEKIARVVPSGTILVTCIASIGKNTMVLDKSGFNQQINSLTPNSNNDSYFLLIQSEFWSRKMKNIAASGTMQIVNKNEFSNLIFSYPTLEEQQKIGVFFKKMDENIVLQQKKLNIYKKQRQGFMQQMFI